MQTKNTARMSDHPTLSRIFFLHLFDDFSMVLMYRLLSSVILLIVVTVFATVDFSGWKVPDFEERHDDALGALGFFMLVYCWIATFLWPCMFVWWQEKGYSNRDPTRDMARLIESESWKEALELSVFGVKVPPSHTNVEW